MGIEPTLPAWKAGVLPLNYTRISTHKVTLCFKAYSDYFCQVSILKRIGMTRFEHATPGPKPGALPS